MSRTLVIFSSMLIMSVLLSSCVTTKKYKELQEKRDKSVIENTSLRKENQGLKISNNELEAYNTKLMKEAKALINDTIQLGTKYRRLDRKYNILKKDFQDLSKQYKDAVDGSKASNVKILKNLQATQRALMLREDSLNRLENEYVKKKAELDNLMSELDSARDILNEKEQAYTALREELARKDSIMNALRTSVEKALAAYENDGLTITRKEGRVYVSMDEKLLFASGSFNLNEKGKEAILKLAKVLEENKDIKIMVEGHTDADAFRGNGQLKDNWDLSVKRATTIVRLFEKNSSIDAKRITAAGRSKFDPISTNETTEGKSKNRRTEIILMPNLDILNNLVEDAE